ncbi:MAG TPA: 2'-5' RNA ligase family protein, partial [Bacteroidia bacterium]|nr:2'-5' RNA ligase family protein [Bacteroidia bacterium]
MSVQKYFIAIVIPEPFQTQLMDLKNVVKDKFNSKGALRSPAHITLHMPFEWKEEKEDVLINTLQQFTFSESFTIDLQNFACFEPSVIFVDVLKNELLEKLQCELMVYAQRNLRLLNQVNDMRGFHPHVTIAFRDLKKDKFYQALDYFKTQTYKATFETKSFSLLKHTGKEWLVHK